MQTYGKGTAADCRRHVQKLNMMRVEKEQRENEQLQNSSPPCSHPPEDYADTFTAQDKPAEEIVRDPETESDTMVTTGHYPFSYHNILSDCSLTILLF